MVFDPAQIRADFPALHQEVHGKPLVYLDNAATTQKPRAVLDALTHYYEKDNSNVHRGLHELSNRATAAYEAARERTARFLNAASADEIIFTRGTTEAVNLVTQTWGTANIREGDIILLTEMEHHSNLVPWQMLASRTGATVRYIPVTENGASLDLEAADRLLSAPVKILALTHISNTLGVVNPVKQLCTLARERGITTFIDGAQSAGHCPVDVRDIGCDFLAMSGHKAAGPTGIGALYGRLSLLEAMPPWQGGGEMINTVSYEGSTWKTPPHKFEAGTPHIAGPIGLHAALDYLDNLGRDAVFTHDQELATYAYGLLADLGFLRILGPATGRSGLVTFTMQGVHAHDIVSTADKFGLALRGGHHCNEPLMHRLGCNATARASFYVYNTKEEVDILAATLKKLHNLLA